MTEADGWRFLDWGDVIDSIPDDPQVYSQDEFMGKWWNSLPKDEKETLLRDRLSWLEGEAMDVKSCIEDLTGVSEEDEEL